MRNFIIIPLVFMLGACWHTNDPRPTIVNGDVSIDTNKICVKSPTSFDDEYIQLIEIFSFNEQKEIARVDYTSNLIKLESNKCLPIPDFQYQAGNRYSYTAVTVLKEKQKRGTKPDRRAIDVSFLIEDVNGKIEAVSSTKRKQ
ncbi:hypothetical protein ISO77_02650 [Morganella morganii subsp. morganii]|uniref:putative T6SS immunity periplasmic lipoprotein n=1 Tax=Morganella morganii TaxID=582 RepID=UPI001BDA0D0B|nr:putative T6SS immunity periplasmic lipoprotein [Morganella morganii]MBT0394446.1 hypothetical protein [Morganella morganii subsp. morganii]